MAKKDHPRGCGENSFSPCSQLGQLGSPPRMRGKLSGFRVFLPFDPDHPRGCGENIQQECSTCGQIGSPPRMRGKQSADPEPENENGITPADAGKTVPSSTRFAYATDHPRGCGENFEQVIDVKQVAGSPPRMRGKQDRPEVIDRRTGITPADAGKTVVCFQNTLAI